MTRVGTAAALLLGLAFLASGPGADRATASSHELAVPAAMSVAPAAVASADIEGYCRRKAGHQFNHCTRRGGSTAECATQAGLVFVRCMTIGCDRHTAAVCDTGPGPE